jgi:hypothetical protein
MHEFCMHQLAIAQVLGFSIMKEYISRKTNNRETHLL